VVSAGVLFGRSSGVFGQTGAGTGAVGRIDAEDGDDAYFHLVEPAARRR